MSFAFKPAHREQVPLLIGLVGPSGGGKSLSALRLAEGIRSVVGGEIFVLDTEARRMLHYADRGIAFQHLQFDPPHGPDRYLEAMQAAVAAGAKIIVVDSMSHEHEGAGGVLEWHESELDRLAGDDWRKREACNMLAWAKPKGARRKLINGMLQMQCHFVMCFRAKEKVKPVKNEKGKTEIRDMGWQAIAGEEFVYEMTDRFLLPPGAQGVPDFSEEAMQTGVPKLPGEHVPLVPPGVQLNEDIGAALARWAMGGKAQKPAAKPLPQNVIDAFKKLGKTEEDMERYLGHKPTEADVDALRKYIKELKAKPPSVTFDEEKFKERMYGCKDREVLGLIADEIRDIADPAARERLQALYRELDDVLATAV